MDLSQFADMMEAKANALPKAVSDATASVALVVVSDLAYSTPVDTSKALSSWMTTLDEPSPIVGTAYSPGSQGSTQDISALQTINAALDVLKNKKPGQTVYVTNNQPYIRRLNEGYSKQQPAGFVERSVLIARNALKRIKLNW